MGVDVSTTVGIGIHVSHELIQEYIEKTASEDIYEELYSLSQEYEGINVVWAGNAWLGKQDGYVFFARRTMRRLNVDDSGVFDLTGTAITLAERKSLGDLAEEFTDLALPIKPYLVRTVS